MAKQIIPREQWERFFAEVSREYEGKSATLEVLAENVGPQLVAYDQTFGEIGVDEHGAECLITILLGETFTHTVDAPLRVYVEPYASGAGQMIQIESASAPPTRLYLSHSAEQSTGRGEIYGSRAEPGPDAERTAEVFPGGRIDDAGDVPGVGSAPDPFELLIDVLGDTTVGPGSDVGATGAVSVSVEGSGNRGAGTTGHSIGSEVDVIDPGGDLPIIDKGADPIGGLGDEDADQDDDEDIDVGAQAERDLTELFDPDIARKQKARRKQRS